MTLKVTDNHGVQSAILATAGLLVKKPKTSKVQFRFSFVVKFILIHMLCNRDFYARQQNASRVLAIVCSSVCHTRDLYQNNAS